jgi:hypothetical protein
VCYLVLGQVLALKLGGVGSRVVGRVVSRVVSRVGILLLCRLPRDGNATAGSVFMGSP